MAYVAPIHKPTSVRRALKGQFLAPDEDCLVVAYAHFCLDQQRLTRPLGSRIG